MEYSKLIEALNFATKMHEGQVRHDGTPYINHPIRVANYVKKYKNSKELDMLVICSYLHDTLEDTTTTYYDLVKLFWAHVASIVLELTTDEDLKKEIGKERYLEIKMKNMSSWALVIKLCDRLDNTSDLENSTESFQIKYVNETIGILEYLTTNRTLSETHINIIKEIVKNLLNVNKDAGNIVRINSILSQLNEQINPKKGEVKRVLLNPKFET